MNENQNQAPLNKILDPKFYLESFCKIKGKTPGLAPFILNEAQKDLFNALNKHSRVIILKARQLGFCQSPDTKVLLSNLEWKRLEEVSPGDVLIGVEENVVGGKGSSRKMLKTTIEAKWDVFEEALEITLEDGTVLEATPEHRYMTRRLFTGQVGCRNPEWKMAKTLTVGHELRFVTRTWNSLDFEDGWFAGIIDGEGSLAKSSRTGASLTVAQIEGPVLSRMLKYVEREKIKYRIEIDKRKGGKTSKFGNKPVFKIVISNLSDVLYLMSKLRPSRLIERTDWWEGKKLPGNGESWKKITSIKSLGKKRMIDLQTSSKTFIANGYVSHNSTAVTGYLYHKTITTPGTNTALIGYNSDLTAELLDKVKTFYRTTPDSLKPKIQYNSKYEISFPAIDSKILVLPSSENVGRGYTLHNVLLTELAFWDKADEKMLAIEQAVPKDGKIIVESTPNGIGNMYHRLWMADNGYEKKEYGWWWGYNEEEIEVIRRRINDPMKFAQEYGLEFLATGRPVFPAQLIKNLKKGSYKVGQEVETSDGQKHTVTQNSDGLIMYHPPQPDRTYVAGADVAEGVTGGDYSVVTIFDRQTGEEVAFWRGYMPPDRFGGFLAKVGTLYNHALMVVEINNHGLTTVTALKNLMYPQIYFRPVVKMDTMGTKFSDRMGWKTTKVTRPLMIDDLREGLSDGSITIRTEKTFDEMLTFVFDDGGNMVTQNSFHDDCIFAAAIAFQGFKVMYSGKLDQIDYETHLPDSFSY